MEKNYKNLPETVTNILPLEQLKKARIYNIGINSIDLVWVFANFIFDFMVILFDIPAFIWYGWLKVMQNDEYCGGDTDKTYGIYMQLAFGILFFITLLGM